MSIISNDVPINTAAFNTNYFSYLMLSGDHNLADSINKFNNFSYSRVFTVSAAGTYRYNLWSDKAYSYCYIQIADANMQAIYFPTGGTGSLVLTSTQPSSPETNNSESEYADLSAKRDLTGKIITGNSEEQEDTPPDKETLLEKRVTKQQEQIDSLKNILDKLLTRVKLE